MMPVVRQRMVIFAAVMVGAVVWSSLASVLGAADGSTGLSLTSSYLGLFWATVVVGLAGLIALGLGLIASAMGNPLSGVFAVSAGLCVLAALAGSIDGWINRSQLPGDYGLLMVEVLVWQSGVVVMLAAIRWLRSPVRAAWPALAYDDHLGVDLHLKLPRLQALAAAAVCSVCGLAIGWVTIRTSDVGQVIGSLMLGFGVGGLAAGLVFPKVNPAALLFSPAIVAVGVYAYILMSYGSGDDLLRALYNQQFPGVGLALPIHYVSAGIAGCTMGVGIAQGIEAAKTEVVVA